MLGATSVVSVYVGLVKPDTVAPVTGEDGAKDMYVSLVKSPCGED